MKLPELGVRRPVATSVLFIGILILGMVSYLQLPIDLMPDISFPTISISTTYPGASAEDVENRVTKVIENIVSTVPNIDEVTSISKENVSVVTLKFAWGTDLGEALNDVRDKLDFARTELPDDAEKPLIFKFDMSIMPILFIGANADESYPQLYDIIERRLLDPLRRVPGVGAAFAFGGKIRQIRVDLDRDRLEALKIPVSRVVSLLKAENLSLPAGTVYAGARELMIRVPGEFRNVAEIRKVVVGMSPTGTPIYLEDVARISDSFQEETWRVRVNGKPGVLIWIQKQSDANTVEVVRAVLKKLEVLKKTLPPDIRMEIIMDASDFIKRSILNLTTTILWGALFVVIVTFLFLRNLRGSVIIALTIPVSLIVAFIFLNLAGYTINMMSLSSLAIAIGMVVDNAIVVFENIYRHRYQLGRDLSQASIFGASEVGMAITASTLTTVAIFLPIIFIKGIVGVLFKQLGLVIIFVLFSSLFCALLFTPLLSNQILRPFIPGEEERPTRFHRLFLRTEDWFQALIRRYERILTWSLHHKAVTIGGGVLIFFASMLLFLVIKTEFLPEMDQGQVQGTIEMPVGTRMEVTDEVLRQAEKLLEKDVPETQVYLARSGTSPYAGISLAFGQEQGSNYALISARLVPKKQRKRSDRDIAHFLSEEITKIPGVKGVDFTLADPFAQAMVGGKPISVEIYGYDLATTDSIARQVAAILRDIRGTTDVEISRKVGQPELWIQIDRQKASRLGLNVATISSAVRTKMFGTAATVYRELGQEYDIWVQLEKTARTTVEDLKRLSIVTPTGQTVRLSNIATFRVTRGPLELERKDQERVVRVEAGLYGRALGEVASELRERLAQIPLPPGVEIKLAGSIEQQQSAFKTLLTALILGALLVYLVMAAQFESFVDPFVIMFSIPFAIIGVAWALLITGVSLNVNSFVGMVMLVGIVVNNAIVLVDYTNIVRERGVPLLDAVVEAGRTRFRPVLMTAFTTIFGLMPLALSRGEGSEMWVPLGVSVIGGLLVSTLITLIFVPTLYTVFEQRQKNGIFRRIRESL